VLNSCGGGGGMTAGSGIDGTGIMSAGVVSAFGSIIVNGTEFDTSNAVVVVKGEEIGVGDDDVQANLEIGMVVTVEGRIKEDGSAVADRVIYSSNVAGPVESVSGIDPITNEKEIVVLGQIVVVNFITKFKPDTFGFDSIALNDVVEVSGYFDDTGAIRATFIEKIDDILEYGVTGFVESLDTKSETFKINDLTVDYSSINPSDLPEDFNNDLFVEVEGELDDTSGELIATAIELADELGGDDGDALEIMGFITEIISDIDIIKFKVGNQEVHVDPDSAVFVDGFPNDIAPGKKLEAEGSLEGGILFAEEIEFWGPDQIEVEGLVTDIASDTEFTVGDQVVKTDDDTVFEPPELEIAVNLKLEVKGVPRDIDHNILDADKVSFEED
ncbi:MAG: hypothetical protein JRC58_06875, partial [Deltaproteobacteria bacterium]|nr:hypothetical protein [Deltaproteobacteria bacterium]